MHNTLRKLRISHGLTIQQLAQHMNVSVEIISLLENGLLLKIFSFYEAPAECIVATSQRNRQFSSDQDRLLEIYNTLNNISRGMLLERAQNLLEESSK